MPMRCSEGGDLQKAVREAAVVPPRRRDPGLPGALEAICLKALAARPEDRYASARALADDLTKWLADEPVGAYREPFAERARRWVKRNRTAVTGAAAALLAGVVGLAAVAGLQARHNRRLEQANAATTKAKDEAVLGAGRGDQGEEGDGGGAGKSEERGSGPRACWASSRRTCWRPPGPRVRREAWAWT